MQPHHAVDGTDAAPPPASGVSTPRDWVGRRLGVHVHTGSSAFGLTVEELVGLGLRRNPKRAQLLVSTVLGKHVPTDPRVVHGAGVLLGLGVRDALADHAPQPRVELGRLLVEALREQSAATPSAEPGTAPGTTAEPGSTAVPGTTAAARFAAAVRAAADVATRLEPAPTVLGYCETATGLGHCVAEALPGADYLHSTRRVSAVPSIGGFEEEHSHATSHLLCPADPGLLLGPGAAARPLVLVDDELSTGRTILNTVAALQASTPRARYVVAALVDLRSAEDEARMAARAADLGIRLDVIALARGGVDLPDGLLERAAAVLAELPDEPTPPSRAPAPLTRHTSRVAVDGGRHGISAAQRRDLAEWAEQLALRYAPAPGARLLVLGTEELMAAPLLLAMACADRQPSATVRFSTTTRSPAVAVDDPGYPLRTAIAFDSDEQPAPGLPANDLRRFAYNVVPGHDQPAWDTVLVVRDEAGLGGPATGQRPPPSHRGGDTARPGLTEVLSARLGPDTRHHELVLHTTGPATRAGEPPDQDSPAFPPPLTGPGFGSYAAEEVRWLLTDLSSVELEAPTEHREREIQSGRAHYAESLPIEFQPDAGYTALFHAAVAESASRLAYDVGLVAELVRHERMAAGATPGVLVSLARAGVPVGILLRRWYRFARGEDVPHYAVSIVRGRGIDTLALDYLVEHEPGEKIFVDGWTGKGAITRELAEAITDYNARRGTTLDPDLVVLADPGRCVRTFGTRDDFLIPSACLNSTVSGLVSRTVLNDELIGPRDFHGAKFYADLAGADVSNEFLDAVSSRFDDVAERVEQDWRALAESDRTPDWAGWKAVERISEQYRIGQVNLVKPGVGETTRVLLRRVPERILIRPGHDADLQHVLMLAAQRGVPVETVDDLPYSCVGLIRPQEGGEG